MYKTRYLRIQPSAISFDCCNFFFSTYNSKNFIEIKYIYISIRAFSSVSLDYFCIMYNLCILLVCYSVSKLPAKWFFVNL